MKKAADFLTWFVVIDEIVAMWIICITNFIAIQKAGANAWWLIVIPIIATLVLLILAWFRQDAVNEGEDYVKWGVITILFLSIPGGILTICLNSVPTRSSYKFKYYSANKPKTAVEEKPVEEFIFVPPSTDRPLKNGDIVKVINGFYASAVGQRVNKDDICEVYEIKGDEVVLAVNHDTSIFHAATKMDNVLVKIKNPLYEEKQAAVEQPSEPQGDKFEEIKKYKELLDCGIITQEEFDKKKQELLK